MVVHANLKRNGERYKITSKAASHFLWEAMPGEHCRSTYSRYCGAVQNNPEPLPENAKTPWQMQLVLNL